MVALALTLVPFGEYEVKYKLHRFVFKLLFGKGDPH